MSSRDYALKKALCFTPQIIKQLSDLDPLHGLVRWDLEVWMEIQIKRNFNNYLQYVPPTQRNTCTKCQNQDF